MCVRLEQSHLHQIIIKHTFFNNLLHNIRILEDQLHQSAVAQESCRISIICLLGLFRHIFAKFLVLMIHIPHRPFRCIHRDVQIGINLQHLNHRCSHRLHTSRNRCADGIHPGTFTEDLWKPLYHPTGNLAMLLFTVARQLSPTFLRIIHHQAHLFQHTMPCGCQFIHTVSMVHHVIRRVIARSTADISRAVTSVV